MTRAAAAAALLALAPAIACASKKGTDPPVPRPRVVVETSAGARHAVDVELARTEPERRKGLMDRPSLPEDAGMLFIFDGSSVQSFWMKNTLIPLDMLFFDEAGVLAGVIRDAPPLSLAPRDPGVASRFVLEVRGGWAARHGVVPGARLRLENVSLF